MEQRPLHWKNSQSRCSTTLQHFSEFMDLISHQSSSSHFSLWQAKTYGLFEPPESNYSAPTSQHQLQSSFPNWSIRHYWLNARPLQQSSLASLDGGQGVWPDDSIRSTGHCALIPGASHLAAVAIGFAVEIYALPVLIAPAGQTIAELQAAAVHSRFTGQFKHELKESDAMQWVQGTVSIASDVRLSMRSSQPRSTGSDAVTPVHSLER